MAATNLRLRSLVFFAACTTAFFFYLRSFTSVRSPQHGADKTSLIHPANSTLGFGAVIAVSRPNSPRRADLIYASNITGIDITVPAQPPVTDTEIAAFRDPEDSVLSPGSLLAWLGHLNAIRAFLATDHETALIFEDDVDWDISLRTRQVPLAARAFNSLLNASDPTLTSHEYNKHYYADLRKWEILFLGHCGDLFAADTYADLPHTAYSDHSLLAPELLHPITHDFLASIQIPSHTRIVHASRWPLCTFGYALTRASAARILRTYATEGVGGCQAYDVRLLEACRDNGWSCYTVNPELMHHVDGGSEIADVDSGEYTTRGERAPNIACGARRAAFKGNEQTREWIRERIEKGQDTGRAGECLVDEMEEDKGRWP